MRFAFCLFRYFPFSGLARDMLRIAECAVGRGHEISIFTTHWEGEAPRDFTLNFLPQMGHSNHARAHSFSQRLKPEVESGRYDAVVGFNKLPELDVYYAADSCFAAKARYKRHPLYRFTPRYRRYHRLESAVFSTSSACHILVLSEPARNEYQEFHFTQDHRFTLLPPTVHPDFKSPMSRETARRELEQELGLNGNVRIILLLGSGFKTKGLDRAIRGLAALPDDFKDTLLLVAGDGNPKRYERLASSLGIKQRVRFLGGRNEVRTLLSGADVLVHPARNENTGTAIIEAIVSGLPVLATGICGYAEHIHRAHAGVVLQPTFEQRQFNDELKKILSADRTKWRRNGLQYAENENLFGMPDAAMDAIEQRAKKRPEAPVIASPVKYVADLFIQHTGQPLDFDSVMKLKGEVYRQGPGRQTIRIERNHAGFYLKRHFGVGWREIIKNLTYLRLPVLGASNEWHAGHLLHRFGIRTPKAVAYGVRGRNPATRESFIVTEEVRDAVSLEELCAGWKAQTPPNKAVIRQKRALLERIATITRVLHRGGCNHRDYYLCHFLLAQSGHSNQGLSLIDLHRMQLRRKTPSRWIVKDLSSLYFSAMDIGLTKNDIRRFICHYKNQTLGEALSGDTNWHAVQHRAFKLYNRHNRKRLSISAHR